MIKTFTGPMHSGKTAKLIEQYKHIYNKNTILCFKPKIDSRDKNIASNAYEEEIPCIGISSFEEILSYLEEGIKNIFIDEVQFMKGTVGVLSYLSIVKDLDIYCAGLNMTSEQEPFLVMPYILAISDQISIIPAACFDCGRDAFYTYYEGKKEKDVVLIGNTGYYPLCMHCLLKRREKEGMSYVFQKKFYLKKNNSK